MSAEQQVCLEMAMRLSPRERAEIAEELWSSVAPEMSPEIEAAWQVEIRRRMVEFESGAMPTYDWQDVLAEARQRLA